MNNRGDPLMSTFSKAENFGAVMQVLSGYHI
jgi:hypothetical protein